MIRSNGRLYIISLHNETGRKCGLSDTGGELSSVMLSRCSRLILVLVQSRRTCEPMRDGVSEWVGLPGDDPLVLAHCLWTHGRSRRWCLGAVWDAIRSLFVSVPRDPRISLLANVLAWISLFIPLSDHVHVSQSFKDSFFFLLTCFYWCDLGTAKVQLFFFYVSTVYIFQKIPYRQIILYFLV